MFITAVYFAPIVISLIALIIDFRKGFDKKAFIVSAMFAMMAEMLAMKYIASTWYIFIFSLIVPFAIAYTVISLRLSLKADEKNDEKRSAEGKKQKDGR